RHLLPPNLGGEGAQVSFVKVPLVHHGQGLAVLVEDLDPLHVGNAQRAGYQVLQQCQVAGEHRIFGGRCQLVGNQLAGGLHFRVPGVQPSVGEEGHQENAEQGGRDQGDQDQAALYATALQEVHGGWLSPIRMRHSSGASSGGGRESECAACG